MTIREEQHRLEAHRRGRTCTDYKLGRVLWRSIPGKDEAERDVAAWNIVRCERRGIETSDHSPAEVDLLRALRFYEVEPELQFEIGPYDADFYFSEVRLVVEVDSKQWHSERGAQDKRRDEYMRSLGFRIWRVRAADIYRDPLHEARVVIWRASDLLADHMANVHGVGVEA